jgi:hypothetical protein
MIKYTHFSIGKKKQYKGWCIIFLWFKIERIGFKNNFLWRLEFKHWKE